MNWAGYNSGQYGVFVAHVHSQGVVHQSGVSMIDPGAGLVNGLQDSNLADVDQPSGGDPSLGALNQFDQSQPHQGNLSSGTLSPQNQGTLHQMLLNNQPQPQQMAAHHIAPHQHAAPLHQQPAPVHQQNPGLLTSNQHPAPLQHQVVPLQQNPAPLQDQVAPLHQQPAPPHQQIDAQHHIAPHQQPVPHPDFLHPAVVALLTITPETETDEIQHMIREAAAVLHAHHQKQCGRAGCNARA